MKKLLTALALAPLLLAGALAHAQTHSDKETKADIERHHQCGSAPWGRAVSPGTNHCGMGHGNNLQ